MNQLKPDRNNKVAIRNVIVLGTAQAFLGAQMPMLFILCGLVGQQLAPNPCLSTLPVSMIIIGSMLTAPFLSDFMHRKGRKKGFILGAASGALGAGISSYAIFSSSFSLLVVGSLITGIYMSSYGFYRFAATDTANESFRPKAISYVMAAGLISAMLGPQLVKITSNLFIFPFLGSFLTIIVLNLFGFIIFLFLKIPIPKNVIRKTYRSHTRINFLKSNFIKVSIICAMISYGLMNLMMTSAPLAVVGCGFSQSNAADVVMAHVLAMTLPSFVTGHLIVKYGVERILALGMLFLLSAGLVGLSGIELEKFFLALILLGIGWNFGFIGATAILTKHHNSEEKGRIQGLNDMIVFGFVAFASLASGGLMNCSSSSQAIGWQAVNIAMFPLVLVAGIAIVWLKVNKKKPA